MNDRSSVRESPGDEGPDLARRLAEEAYYHVAGCVPGMPEALIAARRYFSEALEEMFGRAHAEAARACGLGHLHEFVPLSDLPELKRRVHERMKPTIHHLALAVGRHVLKLQGEFWASDLVITRIHYPFDGAEVASAKRPSRTRPQSMALWKLAHTRTSIRKRIRLFNPAVLLLNAPIIARQTLQGIRFRFRARRGQFRTVPGLETSAVHGPHLDIWNGLPYDGITLWWAADDVDCSAGLLLYPELFGMAEDRSIETASGQFAVGRIFPPPHRIGLRAGEMLLFSEDKMYHATQLNLSPTTRIVISTHLCFTQPRFSSETRFAFERFHSASALETGDLATTRFPFRRRQAVPTKLRLKCRPALERPAVIRIAGKLGGGGAQRAVTICRSDALADNARFLLRFDDMELVLLRQAGRLFCLSGFCPHRAYSLAFGGCDGRRLYCPGHGVAFDLATGKSDCASLHLNRFEAIDAEGMIRVVV